MVKAGGDPATRKGVTVQGIKRSTRLLTCPLPGGIGNTIGARGCVTLEIDQAVEMLIGQDPVESLVATGDILRPRT
eukprot:8606192-Pyramimonas_sp.AAC.1